jgi:pyruvate kinase
MRRTKILATVGPASAGVDGIRRLVRAGADAIRINFSHGDDAHHRSFVRDAREAATLEHRELAVVADLQGPKLRLGALEPDRILLEAGARFVLDRHGGAGGVARAPVELPSFRSAAVPGDPVLLGDGDVELRVVAVHRSEIVTEVVQGGPVASHAGLFLPKARLRSSILGPKDRHDLAVALDAGVDFLALSFVASGADLRTARRLAHSVRPTVEVGWIAKIERAEALEEIDAILAEADAIMVARGDLGIEVPLERLAIEQKRLLQAARSARRTSIVATQMLLSMVHAARPTRAEATDVANAVLDGADAVMLSEESAVGEHPAGAVGWLDRIARATEASGLPIAPRTNARGPGPDEADDAVAVAAVRLAEDLGARAIVTPTHSGRTARLVAVERPSVPILALTQHAAVRRRLALTWGVLPAEVPGDLGLTQLRGLVPKIAATRAELGGSGPFVLTAGYPFSGRPTNLLTVVEPTAARRPSRRRRR